MDHEYRLEDVVLRYDGEVVYRLPVLVGARNHYRLRHVLIRDLYGPIPLERGVPVLVVGLIRHYHLSKAVVVAMCLVPLNIKFECPEQRHRPQGTKSGASHLVLRLRLKGETG